MPLRFVAYDYENAEFEGEHLFPCSFQQPLPRKELEDAPYLHEGHLISMHQELEACLNRVCPNPQCGLRLGYATTSHLLESARRIRRALWDGRAVNIPPLVVHSPAQQQVVQHHVHAPAPVVKNKVIEHHVQAPAPVIKKKVVEHHVQAPAQIIKQQKIEHVYLPPPQQVIEHEVHFHHAGQTTTHEYHEYGGSSTTTKHLKDKRGSSGYYSDDSRRGSSKGKGKGKRRDDDYDRRDSSRRRSHDRKRSSSRSRRDDRNDRSSRDRRSEYSRSRSRSRSRDRHGSSRRRSPSRDDRKRSTSKRTEKSSRHESESYTHQSDDEDDKYHGSDTNQGEHKVPSPSQRNIKTAPESTQEASKPEPKQQDPTAFDPYKALGLEENREKADQTDIKASYRALIRTYHPDKWASKPKEEQDKATERSAEITRANDILGNPKRKAVYDKTGETELWKLDRQIERDAENSIAIVRPDEAEKGGSSTTTKVSQGIANFFKK